MTDRRDPLQILAFFHYAVGAMMAMVAVVPLVLSAVAAQMASPGGDETIRTEGVRVSAIASFGCSAAVLVVGLLAGGVVALAGRFLLERRHHRFCLFAAAVACLFPPFGTLLGLVTLSQLLAPEVRALFADAA